MQPPDPSTPLVSVVVATNRAPDYLETALSSVVAQTWPSWEIVLVDDGGPDPSAIDRLAASIPACTVVHQLPAGVSVARNVGIARSRGDLICFLDDDDVWMADRLGVQVGLLEADPTAVGCHSQYEVIDEIGAHLAGGHVGDPGTATLERLLRNETWVLISTLLAKKAAIDRTGHFHSLLAFSEDMDLIWRLAALGPILYTGKTLVQSRQHGASVSRNIVLAAKSATRVHELQRTMARRRHDRERERDCAQGIEADRRYWSSRLATESAQRLRAGNLMAAWRLGWQALRTSPASALRSMLGQLSPYRRPVD